MESARKLRARRARGKCAQPPSRFRLRSVIRTTRTGASRRPEGRGFCSQCGRDKSHKFALTYRVSPATSSTTRRPRDGHSIPSSGVSCCHLIRRLKGLLRMELLVQYTARLWDEPSTRSLCVFVWVGGCACRAALLGEIVECGWAVYEEPYSTATTLSHSNTHL